jgi:hypothetical protein
MGYSVMFLAIVTSIVTIIVTIHRFIFLLESAASRLLLLTKAINLQLMWNEQ